MMKSAKGGNYCFREKRTMKKALSIIMSLSLLLVMFAGVTFHAE